MMTTIVVLTALALATGGFALTMASRDFRTGSTFRRRTGAAIYLGWSCHGAAFLAALLFDPYRVDLIPFVIAAVIGSVLIVLGASLFVLAMSRFQSFEQVTGTEVGSLVTSGVYRFSRNPQYTGWIVLLTGAAVFARSPVALALAVAVVVAMRIWIPHEERHLEEQFGDEYRRYRSAVPRFIGPGARRPQ